MYRLHLLYIIRRIIPAFAFIILATETSYAVNLDATAGFNGNAKSGAWTPITVNLSNPDTGSVDGELQVIQSGYASIDSPVCSAKVSLPSGSNKRYCIYTKLQDYGGGVVIRLVNGMKTIAFKKIEPIILPFYDTRMVVSIGDKTAKLDYLSNERIKNTKTTGMPMPGQSAESTISVGNISQNDLPDKPAAYDGVDLLLIPDLSETSADPKGIDAIGMWVASGGTLVVSAGPHYKSFQNKFFNEMLPVTVTGTADLPSLSVLSSIGKTKFPGGQIVVANSVPKPGICENTITQSGIPILASRTYGAGRVIFLAFDYRTSPFRDWNGQTAFWKSIITSANSYRLVQPSGSNQMYMPQYANYGYYNQYSNNTLTTLAGVVESNPSIKLPSFGVIGCFLLLYLVVLVPGNYMVLKKRRKLEVAWFTTIGIVIVFSILAYGIGYSMKGGRMQFQEATIIECACNERYASVITDVSLFSPARRTYNMQVSDKYSLVNMLDSTGKNKQPEVYMADSIEINDIKMAMWTSQTFESNSGIDLGGSIKSDLLVDGDNVTGTISNGTRLDLRNCAIIFGFYKKAIPDIPKGQTASVSIKLDDTINTIDLSKEKRIERKIDSFAGSSASSAGSPTLVSSINNGSIFQIEGRGIETQRSCRMLTRLDFKTGDTFILPPESIPARIIKKDGSVDINPQNMPGTLGKKSGVSANLYYTGYFIAAFKLPDAAAGRVSSLFVNGNMSTDIYGYPRSKKLKFDMSIYNYSANKWENIKVGPGFKVKNPDQHISSKGEVRVKAHLDSSNGQGGGCYVNISISATGRGN